MSGGIASSVASLLEFIESLAGKTPPEAFSAIMPGIAGLENVHPLFVHYPIAFFTAFFLFDVIGALAKKSQWRYVASWLLYLGTVSAAFTVVAGLFAAESVEHGENVHDIMETHEHIGIAVLSLSLFLSAWRMKQWGIHSGRVNAVFLCLAGVLCLLLSLGADLGGLMVYQYGVSVKKKAVSEAKTVEMIDQNGRAPSVSEDSHKAEHDHEGHSHSGHNHSHSHGGHNHSH